MDGRLEEIGLCPLLFMTIIKADYPRYWDDKKEILNAFDEVLKFRNQLAHSILDVSPEALARPIKQGIGFSDWCEGQPITDADFNDLDVKANMIGSCLNDIRRLLPFKQKPY